MLKCLIWCFGDIVVYSCSSNSNVVFTPIYYSQNGRISSMDFHRTSSYLVTASDDESIRLYDVASATYVSL